MNTRRSRTLRWSLLAAVVCLALAVAFYFLLPPGRSSIDTSHSTLYPTPGAVTLPPTAPPAPTSH